MAIQTTDLMVIQQGGVVYKVSTDSLATYINGKLQASNLPIASSTELGGVKVGNNLVIDAATGVLDAVIPSGSEFQGQLTASDDAPGGASNGDFWIFSTGGTLNATWGNKTGASVIVNDGIMYDAVHDEWDIITGMFGAGVTSVGGSDPIEVDSSNSSVPVVKIKAADAAGQDGSMSSSDKVKLDSIQAGAEIGTVTEVKVNAPISVTNATTEPVLSIASATVGAVGVVQLADGTAITLGTPGVVVDAAQLKVLKDEITVNTQSITNLDTSVTNELTAIKGDITALETATPTSVLGGNYNDVVESPAGTFTVNVAEATLLERGAVQLATDAETLAGTDNTKAVTPLDVAAVYLVKDWSGLNELTP